MPVHIPVKAEDIFVAFREGATDTHEGEWLIGYRTAREIQNMLDVMEPQMGKWDATLLLGKPVSLTTGYGLTFYGTPFAA